MLAQLAGSHSIQRCKDIAFSCASISIAPVRVSSEYRDDGGRLARTGIGRFGSTITRVLH